MKFVALLVSALLFCLPVRSWEYQQDADKMGGVVKEATVFSLNSVRFSFPYEGSQRARLKIRSHPRWGLDVMLSVERGQFGCSFDCYVIVRFDDEKPRRFSVAEPEDRSSNLVFINQDQAFLKSLKKSKRVLVESSFYSQGTHVFEFDTSGLIWPIKLVVEKPVAGLKCFPRQPGC